MPDAQKETSSSNFDKRQEEKIATHQKKLTDILVASWRWWNTENGPSGSPEAFATLKKLQSALQSWNDTLISEKWSREECLQMVFNAELQVRSGMSISDSDEFFRLIQLNNFPDFPPAPVEKIKPLIQEARSDLKKRILRFFALAGILTTAVGITYAINFSRALEEDQPLVDASALEVISQFDAANELMQDLQEPDTNAEPGSDSGSSSESDAKKMQSSLGGIPDPEATSIPDEILPQESPTQPEPEAEEPLAAEQVTAPSDQETTVESDSEAEDTIDHRLLVENPLELIFNSELLVGTIQTDRATRLGVMNDAQDGREYVQRNVNGKNILVPSDLPEDFWYLADPDFVAQNAHLETSDQKHEAITRPVVSFLVLGVDSRPEETQAYNSLMGRADAIMLLQLDTRTGQTRITSFPRDLRSTPVARWTGRQLNSVNLATWGYADTQGRFRPFPPDFTRSVFEDACGCLIDGMVQFNFAAVVQSIDTLFPEGLTVSVTEAVNDQTTDWQNAPLVLQPGEHTMNGELALKYARSRKGNSLGDLGRNEAQRNILSAILRAVSSRTQDRLEQKDYLGAAGGLFSMVQGTLNTIETLENNANDLVAGKEQGRDIGHLQSFGALTPEKLIEQSRGISQQLLEIAANPNQAAAFVNMMQSESTQNIIAGLRSGQLISNQQLLLSDSWENLPEELVWPPTQQ